MPIARPAHWTGLPERLRHLYVSGATGMGKSTFVQNLALDDIAQGLGVCVIDPHGDLVDGLLERMDPTADHASHCRSAA